MRQECHSAVTLAANKINNLRILTAAEPLGARDYCVTAVRRPFALSGLCAKS
jgi:hypothetical protein